MRGFLKSKTWGEVPTIERALADEMKRTIACERQQRDRFASAFVIAASIMAVAPALCPTTRQLLPPGFG